MDDEQNRRAEVKYFKSDVTRLGQEVERLERDQGSEQAREVLNQIIQTDKDIINLIEKIIEKP